MTTAISVADSKTYLYFDPDPAHTEKRIVIKAPTIFFQTAAEWDQDLGSNIRIRTKNRDLG